MNVKYGIQIQSLGATVDLASFSTIDEAYNWMNNTSELIKKFQKATGFNGHIKLIVFREETKISRCYEEDGAWFNDLEKSE